MIHPWENYHSRFNGWICAWGYYHNIIMSALASQVKVESVDKRRLQGCGLRVCLLLLPREFWALVGFDWDAMDRLTAVTTWRNTLLLSKTFSRAVGGHRGLSCKGLSLFPGYRFACVLTRKFQIILILCISTVMVGPTLGLTGSCRSGHGKRFMI